MAASGRGSRAISALLRGPTTSSTRCAPASQPTSLVPRRFYSEAGAAAAQALSSSVPLSSEPTLPSTAPSVFQSSEPDASASERGLYRIKAGLVLTRPPLLTHEQTPFESAFYLYQKRLNERLSAPFRKQFYFKQDTPRQMDWRLKAKERHGVAARDIGRYNPRGRLGWNDEVLVGSLTSDPANMAEKLVADAEMRISEDGETLTEDEIVRVERPVPRRTEADEKRDVRRLDRALDRTLYLVVRRGDGEKAQWAFPSGEVPTHEALHETAARVLAESAGINMNTWIVGRHPIAHYKEKPVFKDDASLHKKGQKVFFLKGRIMAGQADLAGNLHNLNDFKWLTREELMEQLPEQYFHSVRNMMADR
ncbi:hypothetical protein GQ53DRAFT_825614 [Thozetella sp. PMI_491]|nr:hypothetical protein GQ53DRAFT_825614 [Thozetella sp. PMI_491]